MYNATKMVKAIISILPGMVLGIALSVVAAHLCDPHARHAFSSGIGLGFGAGFGGVTAIWALNKLVGFLDRWANGKV